MRGRPGADATLVRAQITRRGKRVQRRLFGLLGVLFVAMTSIAGIPAVANQPAAASQLAIASQQAAEGWARLGPQGLGTITALAVAPNWPTERLIVAIRDEALVRSRDGGSTWERLVAPGIVREGHVRFFGLLPSTTALPTAFLLVQDPSAQAATPWRLFRSTDGGASWPIVLSGPRATPAPRVVFAPEFAREGTAFLFAGGELWRSRNGGVSWAPIAIAGQRVQQVAISPDFGVDHTVFLAVAVRDRPSGSAPADARVTDHEESLGILVSHDAGDNWAAAPTGLRVDETLYRNVYDLALSPTYRQDGTVFAFAGGPITPLDPQVAMMRSTWSGRLFRSTDRGESWLPVATLSPEQNQGEVTLAFSPNFANDGRAFAAVDYVGPTPASSGCTVLGTANGGRDWTVVVPPVSYYGCERVQAAGSGLDFSLLVRRGGQWTATPGGLGERLLQRVPEGPGLASPVPYAVTSIVPARDGLRDGTLFVGAWGGGIWTFGPDVRRTDGRLLCPTEVAPGFRQVYDTEGWVHGWLGCATGAERRTRVRELEYPPTRLPSLGGSDDHAGEPVAWDLRAYWPEDDDPLWIRLSERSWSGLRKGDVPWPNGLYDIVDATLQRFDGGIMLRVTRSLQPGSTLVLIGRGESGTWREVPDAPGAGATTAPTATPLAPVTVTPSL
jgi:photosystem II stability/assembly factor-like uncharacterized protein